MCAIIVWSATRFSDTEIALPARFYHEKVPGNKSSGRWSFVVSVFLFLLKVVENRAGYRLGRVGTSLGGTPKARAEF